MSTPQVVFTGVCALALGQLWIVAPRGGFLLSSPRASRPPEPSIRPSYSSGGYSSGGSTWSSGGSSGGSTWHSSGSSGGFHGGK